MQLNIINLSIAKGLCNRKVGWRKHSTKIADNGIGIPLISEKIFDMFYRISSKSQGSGIGLYIVKDTVAKLQGNSGPLKK
jgi:signal transduction histidine kinase